MYRVYMSLLVCCSYAEEADNKFFVTLPLPPVKFSHQDVEVDAFADHDDTFSVQPLLDELGDRWQFSWIKQRMKLMWREINLAGRYVTNMSCSQWTRSRLRVFAIFTFSVILVYYASFFFKTLSVGKYVNSFNSVEFI